MIADKELFLAQEKAVSGAAVTGETIDQKAAGDAGESLQVVNKIDVTFAGGTALQVAVETADNDSFSSSVVLPASATYPAAELTAGKLHAFALPKGLKRYWRVKYVPSGTFTAGKISSYAVLEAPNA